MITDPSLGALVAATVAVVQWLRYLIEFYIFILIARALVSWIPLQHDSPVVGLVRLLERLTEPVLAPIRRVLPPVRAGGAAIDLSIIVAILGLEIIAAVIL